jgi:pyruvate/2-oxoglutarate dehydrogenase complex dihydrolipoamide dehydrogenase (E3) component
MKTKIEKIVAREDNPALAGGVIVDGETIAADFVVMGVGVAPATAYLKDTGIELEKDGSIKVDEYLRAVNVPAGVDGVYAAGKFQYCRLAPLLTIQSKVISHSILTQPLSYTVASNIGM